MMNTLQKWLIIIAIWMFSLAIFIHSFNGRYQYIPRTELRWETGTVVMDTRDATIYHISVGKLESFNPLTAQRKEWEISPNGKFKKIHDDF